MRSLGGFRAEVNDRRTVDLPSSTHDRASWHSTRPVVTCTTLTRPMARISAWPPCTTARRESPSPPVFLNHRLCSDPHVTSCEDDGPHWSARAAYTRESIQGKFSKIVAFVHFDRRDLMPPQKWKGNFESRTLSPSSRRGSQAVLRRKELKLYN